MLSRKRISVLWRIARIPLIAAATLFCIQDFLVLPAFRESLFGRAYRSAAETDPALTSELITSSDGTKVDLWRLPPKTPAEEGKAKRVAIFFRGNGGPLAGFFPVQRWLADHGFVAYMFDYRGVGRTGGWPSEGGIDRDGEAVWEHIAKVENITPRELALVGMSLGTGPAAALAAQLTPRALVLFSPYTRIPDVAASKPVLGWLRSLLRYEWPVERNVRSLREGCFITAYGLNDGVIPSELSEVVSRSFAGKGSSHTIVRPAVGHDIFHASKVEVGEELERCFTE